MIWLRLRLIFVDPLVRLQHASEGNSSPHPVCSLRNFGLTIILVLNELMIPATNPRHSRKYCVRRLRWRTKRAAHCSGAATPLRFCPFRKAWSGRIRNGIKSPERRRLFPVDVMAVHRRIQDRKRHNPAVAELRRGDFLAIKIRSFWIPDPLNAPPGKRRAAWRPRRSRAPRSPPAT